MNGDEVNGCGGCGDNNYEGPVVGGNEGGDSGGGNNDGGSWTTMVVVCPNGCEKRVR